MFFLIIIYRLHLIFNFFYYFKCGRKLKISVNFPRIFLDKLTLFTFKLTMGKIFKTIKFKRDAL